MKNWNGEKKALFSTFHPDCDCFYLRFVLYLLFSQWVWGGGIWLKCLLIALSPKNSLSFSYFHSRLILSPSFSLPLFFTHCELLEVLWTAICTYLNSLFIIIRYNLQSKGEILDSGNLYHSTPNSPHEINNVDILFLLLYHNFCWGHNITRLFLSSLSHVRNAFPCSISMPW